MAKKRTTAARGAPKRPRTPTRSTPAAAAPKPGKPSSLLDTRLIYCGDCLEKLADLPDHCIDLIYIDPPFNSNRNDDPPGVWGKSKEKLAFNDRHASTQVYIDYMRPRCVELARVVTATRTC